ncbi:tetratricopeptide repeat protein [Aquisphaera insulae]|uniref:tetratricopeptide repeat protein n=1 Tax=Aquisphaera insulae TaxID=2712864 RepID=UPI0013EB3215|nr:tetratricopeptide repeat protein [Aquisphaera insulae]
MAAVLLGAGWAWRADRSYRDAILQVELDMVNGRQATAVGRLTKLLEQYPGSDEAAVLLARCEQERGRIDAAARALERVPAGSVFAHKAILGRMRLAHDQGRLAAAEQIIEDAARDPRNDPSHTRFLLVPIYSQLGRLDEAERLIEERWERLNERGEGATEPAIDVLRMHIELALKPNPVENMRAYLQEAANRAPDDDRVWLGRANLAIRAGDHAEAERRLAACLKRRPDDPAVWKTRLDLGLAAGRVDVVQEALEHLPAGDASPADVHRLSAWLASRRGDAPAERRELERLLEDTPGDLPALDRLAALARETGEASRADDLLRRKAEVERQLARYKKLFDRNQPIRDAEEMADLAEHLGRRFESRGFLTIALADDPARADLRRSLARLAPPPRAPAARSLADLIRAGSSPAAPERHATP